ncbi:hypothetical protein [Clostridium magnum]|nr:hypothetical protein [Clostridium magnum]
MLNKLDPFFGLNAGFVALIVNTLTVVIVSVFTSEHITQRSTRSSKA